MTTSDRLSLRVESANVNNLGKVAAKRIRREESIGAFVPVSRVGAVRAERIISTLGERERAIVRSVERLRMVTGAQLSRLHFAPDSNGKRQSRRVLSALVERRVLARLSRRIGGARAGSQSYVYRLDVVGQRLVDPLGQSSRS